MKKILLGYNFHREGFSSLEDKFELIYPEKQSFRKEEMIEKIAEANVLIPNFSFYIDAEIMDSAPNLELIANFGVGYNNIDIEYATSKGIVVANTPESVLEPTAELCFGLILATARRIGFYNNQVRQPEGIGWGLYDELGSSVFGKTLGIFGMGRIGQAVARRAMASGMKIVYHNRTRLPEDIENKYNAQYVSFEELLALADVLSLNAPATKETFHLIGENEFKKMKPSAILINTARGALIDEEALAAALKNGTIRAAGLDVFEHEPKIHPELLKLNHNTVLTPHAGTQTWEGRLDMQAEVSRNILGFYSGGEFARVN